MTGGIFLWRPRRRARAGSDVKRRAGLEKFFRNTGSANGFEVSAKLSEMLARAQRVPAHGDALDPRTSRCCPGIILVQMRFTELMRHDSIAGKPCRVYRASRERGELQCVPVRRKYPHDANEVTTAPSIARHQVSTCPRSLQGDHSLALRALRVAPSAQEDGDNGVRAAP